MFLSSRLVMALSRFLLQLVTTDLVVKSVWTDYFSCWATAGTSGNRLEETNEAATTQEADRLDFTVRYSSETAAVNSKEYRIKLGERIYNISNIDDMGFKHNSRKFHSQLTER